MKTINRFLGALLLISAFSVLSFAQTAAPYGVDFPAGIVGTAESTQAITFTNTSSNTLTGFTMTATGTNSGDFSFSASPVSPNVTACATSIAVNAACSITVTFTPGGAGSRVGSLSIAYAGSPGSPMVLPLSGYGNFGGAVTSQPVIPVAATITLTAVQSGALVQMGATAGEVVTLPTPSPGLWYDFVITVTNTSNYNEIESGSASIFLLGDAQHCATGSACLDFWANGTSTEAIKMDGAHLGGLIGSHFHIQGISATQWEISGVNLGTATMTTAFTGTE